MGTGGSIALPSPGRPFLTTLLLLLPLAGPQPDRQRSAPPSLPASGADPVVPQHQASQPTAAFTSGESYRLTPERRALLNTIRYAEGTWLGGSAEGYRMLYGGGRFSGFARHPETEVRRR